eukprot:TRINITY_DN3228_c0_g1_i1.p1 TRINITY_DN3228_c0_g1~~TRINITY_DN3228_c0_g1_i1.p1  ORF type:complete len:280 (+),score=89.71 TRINITY_DN3228_c0_g1_i1:70-909(+)
MSSSPLSRTPRGNISASLQKTMEDLKQRHDIALRHAEYEEAKVIKAQIIKIKEQAKQEQLTAEHYRQENERVLFDEAFNEIESQFEEECNLEKNELELFINNKREELSRTQRNEMIKFEEELDDKLAQRTLKKSVRLLEMEKSEKHLAKLENYSECALLRNRRLKLEEKERQKHEDSLIIEKEKKMARVRNTHERESIFLEQKLNKRKINLLKNQANRRDTLKQQKKNQKLEMNHSHKLEFKSPPLSQKALYQTGSVLHSPTNRGTKLYEKVKDLSKDN